MTNLDSVLKSRDIALLTKVYIVKAMVFPVVIYRSESCAIKYTEYQRIDACKLWCWRRLLRARRSNQSILKEINPEYSLEGEMVGWHHQLNGHEFEQTPGDSEGQGTLVCFSPWGCK